MMNWVFFNTPWFWFFMAVLFFIIEGLTFSLTTIWFALGSLILVFVSFTALDFWLQVFLFLLISSVLLFFTRPAALKKFKPRTEKTNSDRFIGMHAIVVKKIGKFEKGEIKADGVVWTAKTEHETELDCDTECVILRIEGVTAIVAPKK